MVAVKKILLNLAIIVILLVVSNYIYKYFFLPGDIKKHADIVDQLPTPEDSAEIVYFGESSNFSTHSFDIDKRPISKMIASYYPSIKFKTVDKGAIHAEIYKILLENIPEEKTIKTIIITMNFRSFDADWIYSKLETALQKNIVLLKPNPPLYNRFILSFKGYGIKTSEERIAQVKIHWKVDPLNFPYNFKYKNTYDWDRGLAREGIKDNAGNKDYKKTELACHYVKSYAFDIDFSKNPRVKDFDDIVKICRQRKWDLVFNLMAENTEKAKELVGDDLLFLMRRNRDNLIERYQKMGVIVVDNLEDVHTQYYIDQNWTTEHYTEEGRKIVAKNVADSLKSLYPDKFREYQHPSYIQKSFFSTGCEQDNDWNNERSFTDEKVFSGNYSSKFSEEQPYSITFEKPLKYIPDSCKHLLISDCQVYQTDSLQPVKLVVEFRGDYIDNYWYGKEIKLPEMNKWEPLHFEFDLSKVKITDYNLMKVYLLNKGEFPAYVDDWHLNFK